MSDLRENLRTIIEDRVDTQGQRNILADSDLGDILATIRAALLSDEVLLAFGVGVAAYAWSPESFGQVIARGVGMKRAGMAAALDAAGIMEGNDDDA